MEPDENPTADCASVFDLYADVKDAKLVTEYVEAHPHLKQILLEAPDKVRQFFGDQAATCLKLFHDVESGSCELFVIIYTSLPPVEAIVKEHEMLESWWLDVAHSVKTDMTVVVESR